MSVEEIRKRINAFMRWKAAEIEKLLPTDCQIEYYTEEDAKAINKVAAVNILKVWDCFADVVISKLVIDADHCPFCVVYYCSSCPYGKVHGKCKYFRSDYQQIRRLLGKSLTGVIGEAKIKAKLQELFKREGE